jgi:hypothetical protein
MPGKPHEAEILIESIRRGCGNSYLLEKIEEVVVRDESESHLLVRADRGG